MNKLGYQLINYGDIYDKSAIVSKLNTKILGQNLFFDIIDSTNDELKRMAASGACEGTVVVAKARPAAEVVEEDVGNQMLTMEFICLFF